MTRGLKRSLRKLRGNFWKSEPRGGSAAGKLNYRANRMSGKSIFAQEMEFLEEIVPQRVHGEVVQIIGLVIECVGLSVPVGSLCEISSVQNGARVQADVVGFRDDRTLLMPLGDMMGIGLHDRVTCVARHQKVKVGYSLLGRVIDGRGVPIDGKGDINDFTLRHVFSPAPKPLSRRRIVEPLATGIRSIDGMVTCGKGQRMGIFSGSGVGKSVMLGMIARGTSAQANVIALIGERGREVREFIEKDLGEEGLKRSVVVVSTSNEPALVRVKAAFIATTIAEYFRDQGLDVMFMMDSVTRMAMALREIGLSSGEPPTTKGYPPSVFATLPKFLERSGQSEKGTITGFYTVLVEADDMNEPISDAVRSIVDGHVWLSRKLAVRGHYPSVSVLDSISRLMIDVIPPEHREAARKIVRLIAIYRDAEDLISIGAYVRGSNPEIDLAIEHMPRIESFLKQEINERSAMNATVNQLMQLANSIGEPKKRETKQ